MLTALLQTSARKNAISIDSLVWDFAIIPTEVDRITQPPKDGVYMSGIFLEGAMWDMEAGNLADAAPMQLMSDMPVVHFKPYEGKKKTKNLYQCPCYMYPIRTGSRERHPFVVAIDLKVGKYNSEFWTKRGTACLLSTAD